MECKTNMFDEEYRDCNTFLRGTRWHSWLRHCVANRKVVSLIPDGFIGIFH
jgi:hypothetical protein